MKNSVFIHVGVFVLIDLLAASNELASSCRTWKLDSDSENNLDKSMILWEKDDCLAFDCAILCIEKPSCMSFFHHPTLNKCLISQSYKRSLPDGHGIQQGWNYYTEPQQCDGDYTFNKTFELCYKIHPEKITSSEAMNVCETEGAKLIIIKDEMTFLHIQNAVKGAAGTLYWPVIGLRKVLVNGNITWKWWNGQDASYLNWEPGDPNNLYGNEYCVGFTGESYQRKYNDDDCGINKSFICQKTI